MLEVVFSDKAPKAIGPYSQAIVANGFIFCSGQTPLDPETMKIVEGDIQVQTRRVLANLQTVLNAKGVDLNKVVKVNVYLKNFADFAKMNAVYGEIFGNHHPARTTVEVSRLPLDCLVEIECVAVVG